MLSPQIQLYNAIFAASLEQEYDTIDYSPTTDDSLDYPFVFVAETNSDDVISNKDVITGRLRQTVHVWGYAHNRALFTDMVYQLEMKMRHLTRLQNYYLELAGLNSNQIFDNTTTDNLLHGTIEVEYKLT
ncbi:hypothetical protein SAMN05192559_1088 [Halobacillus karajensis]|uniref:Uncharacterized protein n=1 Tax=Halobacillus karajensis TaxID=195088 RepID=A0A024P4A3_9BACI|nr:hypothetical protein [Halobacillus karajensis]CDQ20855.1 hypothetical protein BN982_03210 [Halobacillus karajensis]CDQ23675.1 hypothetical protein BN983_01926 [Halobacillus karajensis]CDQ27153.1 hypothetical protein BN981_01407 [Halobacillus karajensis]SEI03652.1 hypothetical protein SAMN05192559_1088 [Halobacillus karajensis]